ncbi:hypothetical protein IFM89_014408 [Coptis chinensis]|uniref:Uncharacterized protein n=1 Tax=Coptis chinensis TaxID=261450 RepID=A0A835I289_9MAGN|nr:hypothetical protein IFM89_014408 [Coptis chinensis]
MARQVADETLVSQQEEINVDVDEGNFHSNSKRRNDWTEYLDLEQEGNGGGYEPEIATELPKEMFKKPRLKNYSTGMNKSGGKKLYSPTFAKRKTDSKPSNSQVKSYSAELNKPKETKLYNPTFAKRKSFNSPAITQEQKGTREFQPTMAQGPSKWSDYLAEDEDYLLFGTTGSLDDAQAPFNHNMFETNFNDQRVEDEVHPDFH